jgi:hypothetical protein
LIITKADRNQNSNTNTTTITNEDNDDDIDNSLTEQTWYALGKDIVRPLGAGIRYTASGT